MTDPRLKQFEDVRTVLDSAIAAGGATYTLPTPGKAIEWRHRVYRFRNILREAGATPYEAVTIRLPRGGTTCTIEVGPRELEGQLTLRGDLTEVRDDALIDFIKGLTHGS